MGGGGSKHVSVAICENGKPIISELNNDVECFSNQNKKELIYVCIIFIILLIISIHFLHRRR